ncbi:MAG: 6-pyruvoyl-tetrahydropterin synthase-related protein, partial [Chloroflexota bacterium]
MIATWRRSSVLWIILPVLAAALAIYPLLPPGIPSTADGPLHLIRDVEYDALLRSGVWYPRWAPDLAYGYGYPLFNFYAPLFYYLAEIPHLLGASFQLALKLTVFFAFVLYGVGPYWWTRRFLGDRAAAVVGVAYLYVPFRFHEAYMQGDYPQFLALALAPFALGALDRWFAADRVSFRYVVTLTLSVTAILLVHNISALWLAPTLAGYAVILAIVIKGRGVKRAIVRLIQAIGPAVLALGLSAFFWLPALVEQNLVQLYRLRTDDYDVRHSFITLATLLAPPGVVDQTAANPPPFLHLGWGQVAMALLTVPLIVLFLRRSSRS